jgi:release factor glutamine methyltransferase
MRLREAIGVGAARLAEIPELRENAARDAELLLLETLGVSRIMLFSDPDRELSLDEITRFDVAIARRSELEPVQYILGHQEFFGLRLKVNSSVLIPRPETELLVEAVLARVSVVSSPRLVDVGTGSGAIVVSLAAKLPQADLFAVDLSVDALAVARENAAALGFAERIRFLRSDLLEAVRGEAPFDVVVSNPPYVPEGDRAGLHPQVREFEPETALFAGEDGMVVYARLIPQAALVLKPGGLLAMEFGYGQREALAGLLAGWDEVEFLDDLQGIPRVVMAQRGRD